VLDHISVNRSIAAKPRLLQLVLQTQTHTHTHTHVCVKYDLMPTGACTCGLSRFQRAVASRIGRTVRLRGN